MFKIGFGEIAVLFVLALIFLNPKELPKLFRKAGQVFAHLRRLKQEMDETVRRFEEEVRRSQESYAEDSETQNEEMYKSKSKTSNSRMNSSEKEKE